MYVVFCKIDHCIHIHWCIVMGLGHNDPWVESHMWPQQTWGQRSSRGQWPLVQVFGKKGQCIHILWSVFSNLILQWLQKYVIAKSGETRGSRTALLQLYPHDYHWNRNGARHCSVANRGSRFIIILPLPHQSMLVGGRGPGMASDNMTWPTLHWGRGSLSPKSDKVCQHFFPCLWNFWGLRPLDPILGLGL